MAIIGSSVVVGKVVVGSFSVPMALTLRFIVAGGLSLPLLPMLLRRLATLTRREALALAGQVLSGVIALNMLLLYGLKFTTAAEAGLVRATLPAVLGLLSFLLLGERLTRLKVLAIALPVIGVVALNAPLADQAERGPDPLLGNLLIAVAVVAEAIFSITGKITARKVPSGTLSLLFSIVAMVVYGPFSLYEAQTFDFAAVPAGAWIAILYYGIVMTLIVNLLWFWGVGKVPGTTAATFTGIMPISSLVLSYVVLQESFLWSHLLGAICVVFGLWLSAIAQRRAREASI